MDIGGWLRSLGLERYEAVLRDNEIDDAVLHNLTEDHLRELGFPLGARLKLLNAIAALDAIHPTKTTATEATSLIGTSKESWSEAEINRVAGEIALMSPEPDAAKAEAYFERALAVARQQQA